MSKLTALFASSGEKPNFPVSFSLNSSIYEGGKNNFMVESAMFEQFIACAMGDEGGNKDIGV
jgi:hypothetical protein